MMLEWTTGQPCRGKNILDVSLTVHTQLYLKWIIDLNAKAQVMKFFCKKSLQCFAGPIFLRQDIKKKKSDKFNFINPVSGHILSMTSRNTSFLIYYLLLSVGCKFHEETDHIPFIISVSKAYCTLPGSKKELSKHFLNK